MRQRAIKHILLHDARRGIVGGERILSAVLIADDLADPCVHRREGGAPVGEQRHAVGDLVPDAVHGFEPFQELRIVTFRNRGQVQRAGACSADGVQHIGRAIAQLAGDERLGVRARELFGARKHADGLTLRGHRLAVSLREQLHRPLYGGDALALGDDERRQRLPRRLPQDADTLPRLRRPPQIGVVRRDGRADRRVVPAEVEVGQPYGVPLLRRAVRLEPLGRELSYVEDIALGDEAVCPVIKAADAEALPAVRDFGQAEIVRYGQFHDAVPRVGG